jgi:hypothetical protein
MEEMNMLELYHGTDARIIEMSEEEREQYLQDCNLVIDALHPLFKPLLVWEKVETVKNGQTIYVYEYPLKLKYEKVLNEKGGKFMYVNLYEKLTMIDARNNNAGLYQYKDFYLCSTKRSAMSYAQRSYAGGETGLTAYRLIQGAEIIGFENMYQNPLVKQAAEKIKQFAKEGDERPAIVTIDNIDIQCLFHEDGKTIDKEDFEEWFEQRKEHQLKFRYTKTIDLSKCKVELLNKDLYKKIIEENL